MHVWTDQHLTGEGVCLQEFGRVLALVMEPTAEHEWLVDWLWTVYRSLLQPFLALAGAASGGADAFLLA